MLNQFIEGEIVNLDKISREDPKIFHYYTEIIRYWSKLNFIFQKTLRSLKFLDIPQNQLPKYIYTLYRKMQENTPEKNIINELNLSISQDLKLIQFLNPVI